MKSKGFTLIELTIVMIVIGILASIALPRIIKVVEKSRQAEAIGILARMYKSHRTLIIDEILNPLTENFFINSSVFNPDESNISPNNPTGRSDRSWKELGFEQNPNYPENNNLMFSYDYLKDTNLVPGEASWPGPGRNPCVPLSDLRPPGTSSTNIFVAWRKTSNRWITGMELFPIDGCKYIYIDLNTGNITKSEHYR